MVRRSLSYVCKNWLTDVEPIAVSVYGSVIVRQFMRNAIDGIRLQFGA